MKPIATGPKNGTAVLLYGEFTNDLGEDHRGFSEGSYCTDTNCWYMQSAHQIEPSHWMPLPTVDEGVTNG